MKILFNIQLFTLISIVYALVNISSAGSVYDSIKNRLGKAAQCDLNYRNIADKVYISNVKITKTKQSDGKMVVLGVITHKLINDTYFNRVKTQMFGPVKYYYSADFEKMFDSVVMRRFCNSSDYPYSDSDYCEWDGMSDCSD